MRIRILSDLHLDINEGLQFRLKDTETFTVICGDISGYFTKTSKWLNQHIKNGVFVAGNHIVYNEYNHSLQYFYKQLEQYYPLSASLSFLNNSYKIVNDIVFVGGTLWTDYCLYGQEKKDMSIWFASRYMNDYRYARFNPLSDEEEKCSETLRRMQPEDCVEMFQNMVATIHNVCQRFSDKKIVVVTHHAPSEQSISKIYKNDPLNPAFASNLESFILAHPNIKLWCHGHIHASCDYTIGNCRIICNPRGYEKYSESAKATGFNKDLIVEI